MKRFLKFFEERNLNFLAVVLLSLALCVGFFVEFCLGIVPCTLCFLQRIAMIGIAFSFYLNVLLGVQSRFYGFALLWSLLGMSFSLRHIALNICKDAQVGAFLLGPYKLYTWCFIVFFLSILGVAGLLFFNKKTSFLSILPKKDRLAHICAGLILVIVLLGFISVVQKQGWIF